MEDISMIERDFLLFVWPTIIFLQQLHSSEQHSSVLRVCDVEFVQVLLL